MTRDRRSHRNQCGATHAESGQRCTKKPGHYHPVRSPHANDKPGREVVWTEQEGEAA